MEGNHNIFCTGCGAELVEGVKFCSNCGKAVGAPIQENKDIQQDDLAVFIGKNQHYYLNKFEEMRLKNSIASWNWAAFFLGPLWFIYRKMYAYAAIAFVLGWTTPWGILVSIGAGIFANHLYRNWAEKELRFTYHLEEQKKREYIIQRGGTNPVAAWLIGGGVALLLFILMVIGITLFLFGFKGHSNWIYHNDFDTRWEENFDSPWEGSFE